MCIENESKNTWILEYIEWCVSLFVGKIPDSRSCEFMSLWRDLKCRRKTENIAL
jgi:hypothetical protein